MKGFGLNPGDRVEAHSDNVHIVRIARAVRDCAKTPSQNVGDRIDLGLIALRLLREEGYGVVYLGELPEGDDDGE